jgi:hypothetical protein
MRHSGQGRRRRFLLATLAALLLVPASGLASRGANHAASKNDKPKIPLVRWDEERPGCTFSRTEDGRYHYGLWSDNVGVILTVDSQEVEKVHRRHEPFFAALLTVRYRGTATLDLATDAISLEFVKHFQLIQTALDPDAFAAKVQNDSDELDHATAREVEKHPEKKDAKQAYERAFQKDSAELLGVRRQKQLAPLAAGAGKFRGQRMGLVRYHQQMDQRMEQAGRIRSAFTAGWKSVRISLRAPAQTGRSNVAATVRNTCQKTAWGGASKSQEAESKAKGQPMDAVRP